MPLENDTWLRLVFQKDSEDKEIHRLMDLVGALQNLVDLYRKYNCRLALCDFEKVGGKINPREADVCKERVWGSESLSKTFAVGANSIILSLGSH